MPDKVKRGESTSRVDYVVEAIINGIRRGDFAPGQRLVEADLTREFGISRGPLREAMSRLAADGLVVIEPHKGVLVRKLTPEDLQELYDVRAAIESLSAGLAAKNIDSGDNRLRLKKLMSSMRTYKKNGDVMAYTILNDDFHRLIVQISGNRYLGKLVDHLHVPMFRYQFHRFMHNEAKQNSIEDHEAIAKAILAGDIIKAEKAMRKHIDRSGLLIQELAKSS